MSKHTKEPWKFWGDKEAIVMDKPMHSKHGFIAIMACNEDVSARTSSANARRIVACVNACKGLDTEGLERNGLVSAVGYELIELTKQRDELLAAANAVMEWWEEHQYDCDGDCNRYSDDPEFVVLAREAIAKAKGGAA